MAHFNLCTNMDSILGTSISLNMSTYDDMGRGVSRAHDSAESGVSREKGKA